MDEKRGYVQMDVPMPQDMVAYLAALSARFNTCNTCDDQSNGFSKLVQAMIDVLMDSEIDISGCSSEDEVAEMIRDGFAKNSRLSR